MHPILHRPGLHSSWCHTHTDNAICCHVVYQTVQYSAPVLRQGSALISATSAGMCNHEVSQLETHVRSRPVLAMQDCMQAAKFARSHVQDMQQRSYRHLRPSTSFWSDPPVLPGAQCAGWCPDAL